MTDLTQVSDDALKQEVDRREGKAVVELQIEIMEHHKWVLANVDVLLEMAPKHDRTGCSDDSLNRDQDGHGHKQIPRCKRCALLEIKKRNTNYYISVDLMVRFESED